MPKRPCLDCGALSDQARCPTHRRVPLQRKRQRRPRISQAEEARRAATVRTWRAQHGDVCPGWQRDSHPSSDLTADHTVAVGAGGAEDGPLSVLCRSCNGAKADRTA
jgi:5-methylcytosine-specific restriction protein A